MIRKKKEDLLNKCLYTNTTLRFREELNAFCKHIECDRSDFIRDAIEEKITRIKKEVEGLEEDN